MYCYTFELGWLRGEKTKEEVAKKYIEQGFSIVYNGIENIQEFEVDAIMILKLIVSIVLGVVCGVLIGRFLVTYLLWGIGKMLKGNSEIVDIRTVVAYSLIPFFFVIPLDLFSELIYKLSHFTSFHYWVFNLLYILIWALFIKILIKGIMRFNKFGFGKALFNTAPFWIIGFGFYIFALIAYL